MGFPPQVNQVILLLLLYIIQFTYCAFRMDCIYIASINNKKKYNIIFLKPLFRGNQKGVVFTSLQLLYGLISFKNFIQNIKSVQKIGIFFLTQLTT